MVQGIPCVARWDGVAVEGEAHLLGGGRRIALNDAHQLLVVADRLAHHLLLGIHDWVNCALHA